MHTLYNLSQENKVIYAYVSKYIKGLSERAKTGCRQAKEKKNKQTKKKKIQTKTKALSSPNVFLEKTTYTDHSPHSRKPLLEYLLLLNEDV